VDDIEEADRSGPVVVRKMLVLLFVLVVPVIDASRNAQNGAENRGRGHRQTSV